MADLVDLKRTKAEKKKEVEANKTIATSDAEDYSWGTRFMLGTEELDKLGISSLPAVGTEMTLEAHVKVVGCNESATEGQKKRRTMDLQITAASLGNIAKERKSSAEVLYGGKHG